MTLPAIDGVLCLTEVYQFHEVPLWTIHLSACTISVMFRKSFPVPLSLRLSPTFPSIRLYACDFMLRSLFHLDWSFVQSDKCRSIYTLLDVDIQFEKHCWLICWLSHHCVFMTSLSKSNVLGCMDLCLGLQFNSVY